MRSRLLAAMGVLVFLAVQTVHAQTVTLRYGQIPSTIKTVSALQFYVAQRKGFFAREGINLEMLPIEGGADNMVVALDKGVVDVTRTATPYLIQAVLKGSEGVAIAGETATPIYSLVAKPEIKTFADLKGKVVGLSLAVDTISISTRKLIAMNGIREPEFRVKELVGTPARADCLRKGECDAVPLGQPEDFVLMSQGYNRLGVSTDAVPNFQFIVSAVRRSWGEKNKDALVRYVRGLASAYRFIRDPAQPRRGRKDRARHYRVVGRYRAQDAFTLLRAGPRRHAQARRDRRQGIGASHSVHGRSRRTKAAPPGTGAFCRSSILAGGRDSTVNGSL